jgi:diguanylate cyclase (GGDEF)-like protein/PAS domain S-box-containing protein
MSRIRQARSLPRPRGAAAALAGQVHELENSAAAEEQRRGPRRRPRSDRAAAVSAGLATRRNWIPPRWHYVIVSMAGSIASSVIGTSILPRLPAAICLAAAIVLASGVGLAHRLVQTRGVWACLVAASLVVVLPLFLFSLGMTLWAIRGGLPWEVAVAALLCVGSVAGVYLRRLPAAIFASQLALWSATVLVHESLAGTATLLVAAAVAMLVNAEQNREQRLAEERRRAGDRIQTRARDILADYEETRQGWFWETDRRALLTYISAPVAEALGQSPDALIGQPLVELFDLADTGQESERTLQFHFTARSAFQELAVHAAIPGEERWWSVSGRPIHDEFGNFVGFRGSGTDLTAKRRSEEQASRLAHFDSLTGLANRFQMSQALEKILTSQHEADRSCAVLLLDLDRFKHVNDTLGHPAGDALLKQVAQRLARAAGQAGQVGRRGGDEFEVIVPGRIERRAIGDIAAEIIHSLSQPYSIDGQRVIIGASVGIALSPDDGVVSEELIRNADLALYAAKRCSPGSSTSRSTRWRRTTRRVFLRSIWPTRWPRGGSCASSSRRSSGGT